MRIRNTESNFLEKSIALGAFVTEFPLPGLYQKMTKRKTFLSEDGRERLPADW